MSDKFVQPIAQSNYELVPLPGAYITDGRFVRYEGDKNISDTVKDFDGKISSATEAAEEASDKADALDVRVTALENKPSGDDYSPLKNKPKINGVELSGNKTAEDLNLGTYSKPSGGIPKTDLAEAVQQEISEKIDAPQTATVGQVLAVKAVDASGKPTEWETVEKGGGGSDVDAYPAMFMAQYLPFNVFYGSTGATVLNDEIYIAKTESGNTLLFKFNGSAWEKLSSFNYSSSYYSGNRLVTLNNELYLLVDRYVSSTNYDFSIYKFDFDNKKWTQITTYNRGFIANSSIVTLNNQMHIFGGDRSGATAHLVFDGEKITTSVSTPYKFSNGRAVVYNNEIHIFGSNLYNRTKAHYKFDGNSWREVSTLPYDFYDGNAFVLNDKIHLTGFQGSNSRAISHYSKSNTSSEWIGENWLPYNSLQSVVVERKGIIYILGGNEYVQCWYSEVEQYGQMNVNRMILTI